MKICIKGKEFNTNYHIIYSEEKAIANGYSVFEVPQGYEDCYFEDFDENGFNIDLYNLRRNKVVLEQELSELVNWFEGYYRTQIEQYSRCQRMGIEYDKDVNELDSEAASKQLRIREIRELLK